MKNEMACLLIHGFGGGIHEIEPLARHLENKGFEVRRTVLAGHTGNRKDMREATRQDWIRSAERDYLELSDRYSRVVIAGFSTGGLIAANLASRFPVAAVVTISTPIYVWDIRRILINILHDIRKKSAESLKWYAYSSFSFPPSSLIHFQLLLHKTKSLFPSIECPFYVLQGLDDDTVHHRSADYIYRRVASAHKRLDYFEPSGHVMLNGPASSEAIQKISEFIDDLNVML